MADNPRQFQEEISDLKHEIETFKKDKEKIKAIVGEIGGMPKLETKLLNILFLALVISCFVVSIISEGIGRILSLEFAIAIVSIKLIYLMYNQARVNHFQLWILTSLEWRVNELIKLTKARVKE